MLDNNGKALEAIVTHVEDKVFLPPCFDLVDYVQTTFHLNITLADLDAIGIRMNSTCLLNGGKTIHVSSYPFCGVPHETGIVLGETPEDNMCLFAMSEFRNKPATEVLSLGLSQGSTLTISPFPEAPRTFKRKPMPPPIQLE